MDRSGCWVHCAGESLFGFDLPQSERGTRISVVNSVKAGSPLSFYAMVTAGIPRLISADADALGDSLLASRNLPDTVADVVQIGNEEALIPNLETIEQSIGSVWAEFSR
jgi:hypothetical protein